MGADYKVLCRINKGSINAWDYRKRIIYSLPRDYVFNICIYVFNICLMFHLRAAYYTPIN